MSKAMDLTGQKFGRLAVMGPTNERRNRKIIYCCWCDCSKKCFVRSADLRNGHTKSCGCLVKELTKKHNTKHGMYRTLIYYIWRDMLARCENPKNPAYKNYGGRGIKVCERWHSFENFYEDVGDPPEGMTLDRYPDNDGNYEPLNFRWATWKEQQNNKRPISCGSHKQRWFFAFNLDTGEWFEDDNQKEFARQHKLNQGQISNCLHKKLKAHKNWTFQWLPS